MNIFDRLSFRVVVACVCVLVMSATEAVGKERGALRKILNEQESGFSEFGSALAIDGTRAVIGAAGSPYPPMGIPGQPERERGSALVIDVESGEVLYELTAPEEDDVLMFGRSVTISGDVVAVSAIGKEPGRFVYVYDLEDGALLYTLTGEGPQVKGGFGAIVKLEHPYLLVTSPNEEVSGVKSGAVYVYDALSGSLHRKLFASDGTDRTYYGSEIAIDGDIAMIGAFADEEVGFMTGAIYVVDVSDGTLIRKMLPPRGFFGMFGEVFAMSGNTAVIGNRSARSDGEMSGAAWVYNVTTGEVMHVLVRDESQPHDFFGVTVAVRGRLIVVGAVWYGERGNNSGTAYMFDADKGAELGQLAFENGHAEQMFGASIAISDSHILVGAPGDNELGFKAGAAYVFDAAMPQNPADFNGDDCVDAKDLRLLLGAWGGQDALLDISRNGVVDSVDLAKVLLSWGCE